MPRVTVHAQRDVTLPKPGLGHAIARRFGKATPTYVAPLIAEAVVDTHTIERTPVLSIHRDQLGLFLLVQMDFTPDRVRVISTSLREVGEDRTKGHRVKVGALSEPAHFALADTSVRVSEAVTLTEAMVASKWATLSEMVDQQNADGLARSAPVRDWWTSKDGGPVPVDWPVDGGPIVVGVDYGRDTREVTVSEVATIFQLPEHLLYAGPPSTVGAIADADANSAKVVPLFPEGTNLPSGAGDAAPPTSATSVLHDLRFIAERLEVAQFQIAFTAGGADATSVDNDAHVALKALQLLEQKIRATHAQAQQAVVSIEAARLLFAEAEAHHIAGAGLGLNHVRQMRVHLDNARHHARRAKAEHNPAIDLPAEVAK